jgi:predicted SpoU family rRNA methylase
MVESVRLFVVQNNCVQRHGGDCQVVCGSEWPCTVSWRRVLGCLWFRITVQCHGRKCQVVCGLEWLCAVSWWRVSGCLWFRMTVCGIMVESFRLFRGSEWPCTVSWWRVSGCLWFRITVCSVVLDNVRLFVVQNDCVQCHGGEFQVVCGLEWPCTLSWWRVSGCLWFRITLCSVMVENVGLFVVQNDRVQCHGGECQVVCDLEWPCTVSWWRVSGCLWTRMTVYSDMMESVRLFVVQNTSRWIFCVGSIIALCHLITAIRSTQTLHPSNIYIRLFLFSAARCGRSLDHLREGDTNTCCRRGLLFFVCMQDRHLVCPNIQEQQL